MGEAAPIIPQERVEIRTVIAKHSNAAEDCRGDPDPGSPPALYAVAKQQEECDECRENAHSSGMRSMNLACLHKVYSTSMCKKVSLRLVPVFCSSSKLSVCIAQLTVPPATSSTVKHSTRSISTVVVHVSQIRRYMETQKCHLNCFRG